jgi:membrane carboxypeptidase/penicillin-binding protein
VFVAAPIWRSFMDKALDRYPDTAFVDYQRQSQIKTRIISEDEKSRGKNEKKNEKKTKKHG